MLSVARRCASRVLAAGFCLCVGLVADALGQTREQKAQALIAAYPDFLSTFDGASLVWKDGTRMPFGEGLPDKPLDEVIDRPDIADMFRWPYPFGEGGVPAAEESDPGRVRNEAFFEKMYGPCRKQPEGQCRTVICSPREPLARVAWVPAFHGGSMQATPINGVSAKLSQVSKELAALDPAFARYLTPSGGSYYPRCIARTTRLSVHSFGIAFDMNAKLGQYWQDGLPGALDERQVRERKIALVYKNKVPLEIVKVFEKHGFIWGGKWYHFDTMHFEYRPELLTNR